MRSAIVSLGFFALASAASDVVELKKDTFVPHMDKNELVLVKFFAPWCGYCKAIAPEYEEAATALKEKNISLVKVDCTVETELCQEQGIEGYPTLKVFRGNKNPVNYSGPRKYAGIVSFMTKQSLPAVSDLSKETIEDFKTSDSVVVVGYFAADDKASNETFAKAAASLRDNYLFGATNDASLAEAAGVKRPALVLYKDFDEGKAMFTDEFEVDAITKFTRAAATPLIGEVGPETYQNYMSAGLPLAYIFAETSEEQKALAKELQSVAGEYKGKINFATIDAKAFGQHASNLNLEEGKWPAFAIQDTVKNLKFPYEQGQEISAKKIGKFVKDFASGELKPSIKSEPVPENQDGPVTIIVAHNYDEIVLDDEKDVLVEFYAPWCGHCKALAPKYDELGNLYKPYSDKVVIAKVDATANDVPDEVQGFPTIKLFPAGSKSAPVTFSGDRTVEAIGAWIKVNGKHQIDAVNDKESDNVTEADDQLSEENIKRDTKKENVKEEVHDEL